MPVLTSRHIPIFPADRAQPLAVFTANRADRNFENQILPHQRSQINITIGRHQQIRLSNTALIKRVQLAERRLKRLHKLCQAAHTYSFYRCMKISLHKKPLLRAGYPGCSLKIIELLVGVIAKRGKFKLKIPVRSDRSVNKKTNIDSQREARKVHRQFVI